MSDSLTKVLFKNIFKLFHMSLFASIDRFDLVKHDFNCSSGGGQGRGWVSTECLRGNENQRIFPVPASN